MLTTPFDFARERGCGFRSYFSDPDEWANLFKVAGNDGRGLWRVVFPTLPGETDEEVFNEDSVQQRIKKFFPKSGTYPIVHRNLYNVHQRVAARFSRPRFFAGDAAINNPIKVSVSTAEFTTPWSSPVVGQGVARQKTRSARARRCAPPAVNEVLAGADHRQQETAGGQRPEQRAENFAFQPDRGGSAPTGRFVAHLATRERTPWVTPFPPGTTDRQSSSLPQWAELSRHDALIGSLTF